MWEFLEGVGFNQIENDGPMLCYSIFQLVQLITRFSSLLYVQASFNLDG
jgi:hypothetical protein